jgi:hypothetical protein
LPHCLRGKWRIIAKLGWREPLPDRFDQGLYQPVRTVEGALSELRLQRDDFQPLTPARPPPSRALAGAQRASYPHCLSRLSVDNAPIPAGGMDGQ